MLTGKVNPARGFSVERPKLLRECRKIYVFGNPAWQQIEFDPCAASAT
jgi:hypothetical protein